MPPSNLMHAVTVPVRAVTYRPWAGRDRMAVSRDAHDKDISLLFGLPAPAASPVGTVLFISLYGILIPPVIDIADKESLE